MDMFELVATPLQLKPIIYGSSLANHAFLFLIWIHVVLALMAPAMVFGALFARTGSIKHRQFGKAFVVSMLCVVASGVLLDLIRLSIFTIENHTKYAGLSMPSSYPARFAFLYASICIFLMLIEVVPARNQLWHQAQVHVLANRLWPLSLFTLGIALTVFIYTQYNPWTGALWLIWTFTASMFLSWLVRYGIDRGWFVTRLHHRLNMLIIASFVGWGAYQGFYPAYQLFPNGASQNIAPYTGNLPGLYSADFIYFFRTFAPFFAFGTLIFLAFSIPLRKKLFRNR